MKTTPGADRAGLPRPRLGQHLQLPGRQVLLEAGRGGCPTRSTSASANRCRRPAPPAESARRIQKLSADSAMRRMAERSRSIASSSAWPSGIRSARASSIRDDTQADPQVRRGARRRQDAWRSTAEAAARRRRHGRPLAAARAPAAPSPTSPSRSSARRPSTSTTPSPPTSCSRPSGSAASRTVLTSQLLHAQGAARPRPGRRAGLPRRLPQGDHDVRTRQDHGRRAAAAGLHPRTLDPGAGQAHSPTTSPTVIFSSGSTGEPKGVMLTHGNVAANVESMIQAVDLAGTRPAARHPAVLPHLRLHGHAVGAAARSGRRRSTTPTRWQAQEIGELCRKHARTIYPVDADVPAFVPASGASRTTSRRCGCWSAGPRSCRRSLAPGVPGASSASCRSRATAARNCRRSSVGERAGLAGRRRSRRSATSAGTVGQPRPRRGGPRRRPGDARAAAAAARRACC